MRRSGQKIITTHSKILRCMRISKGLSMRKAAAVINLSDATVNHVENGRMDVNDQLIARFVKAYGYTKNEYNDYLKGKIQIPTDFRNECISILKNIDKDKLKAIHGLLSNF